MTAAGYALFDTAIGACGIAWGPRGIVGVQLPEAGEGATRARMAGRFPLLQETEPGDEVKKAAASIRALMDGEPLDLAEIVLDYEGVCDFHVRVYEIARRIVPGRPAATATSPPSSATRAWRAPSARRWATTLSRQWCPAIACSPRAASPAASRRTAARRRRSGCR